MRAENRLAFLVLSGSFNPVHNQHLAILERSRSELAQGGWTVRAGFLAPSSEAYVTKKLGKQSMSLEQRVGLCRLATASSDWIQVCDWGEMSSYRVSQRLRDELMAELDGRLIEGIEIMGSDTVIRLVGQLIREWDESSVAPKEPWYEDRRIFALRRPGPDADADLAHVGDVIAPRAVEFGVLITTDTTSSNHALDEVSSSTIRELVGRSDWAALERLGWLHPDVLDALATPFGTES